MSSEKKKKHGGRDFLPGNRASVGHGRPKLPKEIKHLRTITKNRVEKIAIMLLQKSQEGLKQFCKNKNSKSLSALIGRVILMGIAEGSPIHLKFIVELVLGPMAQKIQVDGLQRNVVHIIIPDNGRDKPLLDSPKGPPPNTTESKDITAVRPANSVLIDKC